MIVEDDALLAELYRTKFATAGYLVEVYSNAESALLAIKQTPPDIITLDILLPGHNGLWLLKELQVQQIRVPVIMLTNLAEADFAMPPKLRQALGVVGYFVKTQSTPAEVLQGVQGALV